MDKKLSISMRAENFAQLHIKITTSLLNKQRNKLQKYNQNTFCIKKPYCHREYSI